MTKIKVLSLFLALLLLLPSASLGSEEKLYKTKDGFLYTLQNNLAVINGYEGEEIHLVIPAQVDGYKAEEIRLFTCPNRQNIKTLVVSEGIKVLGGEVFEEFSSLIRVTLPDSLEMIEEWVFYKDASLREVRLGQGDITIGVEAFGGCYSLEYLALPPGQVSIYSDAFSFYNTTIIAKKGSPGERYTINHNIPFIAFDPLELSDEELTSFDLQLSEDKAQAGSPITAVVRVPYDKALNAFPSIHYRWSITDESGYTSQTETLSLHHSSPALSTSFVSNQRSLRFTPSRAGEGLLEIFLGDRTLKQSFPIMPPVKPEHAGQQLPWAFQGDVAFAEQDGKFGLVNQQGQLLCDFILDDVRPFLGDTAIIKMGGSFGLINRQGLLVHEPQWDSLEVGDADGTRYIAGKQTSEGFMTYALLSATGESKSSSKLRRIRQFSDGFAWAMDQNQNPVFIDLEGSIRLRTGEWARDFHEGYTVYPYDGTFLLVSKRGWHIMDDGWLFIADFKEGMARALDKNKQWRFITDQETILASDTWYDARDFNEGLAAVQDKNGKWGYISNQGEAVIDPKWAKALDFSESLAAVSEGNGYSFINTQGELVISDSFDEVQPFSQGFSAVKKDGRWYFINSKGENIFGQSWLSAGSFHEGLAWVSGDEQGGALGYLDLKGKLVIPYNEGYNKLRDALSNFRDGLAAVHDTSHDRILYINTSGQPVSPGGAYTPH